MQLIPFRYSPCRTTDHTQPTMGTQILILHPRSAGKRCSTFTQLDNFPQKAKQRKKWLARTFDSTYVYRIKGIHAIGSLYFSMIFFPNSVAKAKSDSSGRPIAIGCLSVLYECSPIKVAPAITFNP